MWFVVKQKPIYIRLSLAGEDKVRGEIAQNTNPSRVNEQSGDMNMLLPDGKITPEGISDLKKRIGVPLRIKTSTTRKPRLMAIRHFAHGIGDPNEMWDNPGHGFAEHLRRLVAHDPSSTASSGPAAS